MPPTAKSGNLPTQAAEEFNRVDQSRQDHEMVNGRDEAEEEFSDEAYNHKPIARGTKHTR